MARVLSGRAPPSPESRHGRARSRRSTDLFDSPRRRPRTESGVGGPSSRTEGSTPQVAGGRSRSGRSSALLSDFGRSFRDRRFFTLVVTAPGSGTRFARSVWSPVVSFSSDAATGTVWRASIRSSSCTARRRTSACGRSRGECGRSSRRTRRSSTTAVPAKPVAA